MNYTIATRFKFPQISCALTAFAALGFIFTPAATAGEFRTIDGTDNNLAIPDLGAAETELRRVLDPDYEDNISVPRGGFNSVFNGPPLSDLPNPRTISNTISNQDASVTNFLHASDWLWQWGQLIDHDLDLVEDNPEQEFRGEFDPISVPPGDPFFDDPVPDTLPFVRVSPSEDPLLGGVREHNNQITSFIDASSVYGSDDERAEFLRDLSSDKGLLKVTTADNGETILPLNPRDPVTGDPLFPNATGGVLQDEPFEFIAGDIRANEQVGLTAAHTLLVREHNRVATELHERLEVEAMSGGGPLTDKLNDSGLDKGDFLYESARKVVGAKVQKITYDEFLPLLIGDTLGDYGGYDDTVDPSVSSEFANAAYRLGHTLLSPDLQLVDESGQSSISLEDAFFDPVFVQENGVDSLLLGLATQKAQELDNLIVSDVRSFLFPAGTGGLDLAAINIARGRDVGLPGYTTYLEELLGIIVTDFDGLGATGLFDDDVLDLFEAAYTDVSEIDLWIGGISELPDTHGGLLGPTLTALIADTFGAVRDGDRFFFLSDSEADHLNILDPTVFTTTLAELLRDNTDAFVAANIQDNAFIVAKSVPEPATILSTLGLGLFGVASRMRRQRRQA